MRFHFQKNPWDLHICIGSALSLSALMLLLDRGSLLSIVLVSFVPGYLFVAVLFPGIGEIEWVERLALSFGLSVAVDFFVGLLLNLLPSGIHRTTLLAAILTYTVGVGSLAYWRRFQLPVSSRLAAHVNLELISWRKASQLDKVLNATVAGSIVVALAAMTYVALAPRPSVQSTEFAIFGPTGGTSGYPIQLNVSQDGTVILYVVNHENADVNYTVRVDLVGEVLVYNATAGYNETVEANRTAWSWFNFSLQNEANWTRPYDFRIGAVGLWKVQFLLFQDGNLFSFRDELHFYVRVT